MKSITLMKLMFLIALNGFLLQAVAQQNVIVHTVDQGQTLYSISKLYKTTPDVIQEQNPLIKKDFVIKPGQVIRIRVNNETDIDSQLSTMAKEPTTHIVKEKETLYGISKDYGVSIDQLREWNQISDNRISVGQNLTVGWRYNNKSIVVQDELKEQPAAQGNTPEQKPEIVVEQPVVTTPSTTVTEPTTFKITDKQELLQRRYSEDVYGNSISKESGPAIWFDTENRMLSSRYYGLYSNAQIGSVVKVENLINNRVVYVKVIGSLPDTAENHGAMIKLTPAAKQLLQTSDGKIRVEVSYLK